MHGDGGVWLKSEDWNANVAPATPVVPDFSARPERFERILINFLYRFLAFLTGSGSQTEFAVTHSKQMTAQILTGARTVITHSTCSAGFSPFFVREIRCSAAGFLFPASNSSTDFARFYPGINA
jgi:hypothetical protein